MDLDREKLQEAHCWFATDHVPHDPITTTYKREARLVARRLHPPLPVEEHQLRERRTPLRDLLRDGDATFRVVTVDELVGAKGSSAELSGEKMPHQVYAG